MDYAERIRRASGVAEIFDIVKSLVSERLGADQAGLLVGLSDLGAFGNGFIGAYYAPSANTIVINRRPLARILQTRPDLHNFYLFHIVLHEYIHSLGCYEEDATRAAVEEISRESFGAEHPITQFCTDMEHFIPELTYPTPDFELPEDVSIDFVMGIDRKNTNYIC
jgi:hypothetical protein